MSNFATIITSVTKVASVSWLLWLQECVGCVSLWGYFFFWPNSPQWARVPSFMRFLDHTQRRTTVSVGLLWTSDQLVAETCTWQHTIITTGRHPSIPPLGIEPINSAGESPQTYASDRAATGTGSGDIYYLDYYQSACGNHNVWNGQSETWALQIWWHINALLFVMLW